MTSYPLAVEKLGIDAIAGDGDPGVRTQQHSTSRSVDQGLLAVCVFQVCALACLVSLLERQEMMHKDLIGRP